MIKLIVLGIIGIAICTILLMTTYSENKSFKRRKIQSRNLLKENILRSKLNELTVKKVKASKRLKVEKLCIQAGYNLSYSDYLIVCVLIALACFVVCRFILRNAYLSIILTIAGLFFPNQYFMVKANQRVEKINNQVGPFLKMVIERFKLTNDIKRAIIRTSEEFQDEPPISTEIKRLVAQIDLGRPVDEALSEFAERIDNKFLLRFVDYYKIYTSVGTEESKALLDEALAQYNEDRKSRLLLKKEISSVKSEAYIVLAGIPAVAVYQIITNPDYVPFMTQTVVGQIGTAVIITFTLVAFWFVNKKIGAPIK
jgi:tight adherence protein B